jgi:hypothetical protein
MPSEADYLTGAERNKALAVLLSEQDDPSWAAVLAFYSALHFVNAYLARQGFFPRDHETRGGYITRLQELKPIYGHYRKLEERSRWVRYDLRRLQSVQVEQLLLHELATIETLIRKLLSPTA